VSEKWQPNLGPVNILGVLFQVLVHRRFMHLQGGKIHHVQRRQPLRT